MGINQKAILMHMKQHFPTSDCWTNIIKAEACKDEKKLKECVQQSCSAMQKYRRSAAHSG
jgi:hypothetical protein